MASRSSEEACEVPKTRRTSFERRLERVVPEASLLALIPALAARHYEAKDELRPILTLNSKRAQHGVHLPGPGFSEAAQGVEQPQHDKSSKVNGKRRARTSDDEASAEKDDEDAFTDRVGESSSERKAPQQTARSAKTKSNVASRFQHSALVASAILLEEFVLFSPQPRESDVPAPPRLFTPPLPSTRGTVTRGKTAKVEPSNVDKKRRRRKRETPISMDWVRDVNVAQIEATPPDDVDDEE